MTTEKIQKEYFGFPQQPGKSFSGNSAAERSDED
jgi:hypothetical protein